jgi:uncharacterized coiled-coil protein SlyX
MTSPLDFEALTRLYDGVLGDFIAYVNDCNDEHAAFVPSAARRACIGKIQRQVLDPLIAEVTSLRVANATLQEQVRALTEEVQARNRMLGQYIERMATIERRDRSGRDS